MGEPAGGGGETIVEACAALAGEMELVVFGDPDWLAAAAALRDVPFNPKAARAETQWSPAESWHRRDAVMAAMPEGCARQAGAPSRLAIRASSIATVGFCRRE